MEKIITLLLLAAPFNGLTQEALEILPASEEKKECNLKWGISFSPDISYRTLTSENEIAYGRDEYETTKLGFTTGLNLLWNFKPKWNLETGIHYSVKGEKTCDIQLMFYEGPQPGDPQYVRFNYNVKYIDIPVKINYLIGKRNTKFILTGGASANIFLRETVKSTLSYADGSSDHKKTSERGDYKAVNPAVMIGCGIETKLCHCSTLRIEPILRHSILPVHDGPIKGYFYSMGLNTAIYF